MDVVQSPSRTIALSPLQLGILLSVSTMLLAGAATLLAILVKRQSEFSPNVN